MITIPVGVSRRRGLRSRSGSAGWLVRCLAGAAALGLAAGAAGLGLLQAVPAARDLDPVQVPLSSYALSGAGGLFDASVLVLAAAAVLLGCAFVLPAGGVDAVAAGVLGVTGAGLVGLAVFPDTVTAAGSPTVPGWVHVAACLPVFAGPPVAGWRVAARPGVRRVLARLARVLAVTACVGVVVLAAGLAIPWLAGAPGWGAIGLVERSLAGVDAAVAVVLCAFAWTGVRLSVGRLVRRDAACPAEALTCGRPGG